MMSRILFVALLLFGSALGSAAQQAPPPPPPPLIYEAPATTDIKSFTAADKSFTADFPGKPEVDEKMMGNGKVYSFRVYRKGSNSVIGITEFMDDLSSESERVFKVVRERMQKRPDTKIVSEKEAKLGGYTGKEFVIDDGFVHRISRVFIVRQRIYEIYVDVTNWHILTRHNPEIVAAFEKEAVRFFDSFHLTETKQ